MMMTTSDWVDLWTVNLLTGGLLVRVQPEEPFPLCEITGQR